MSASHWGVPWFRRLFRDAYARRVHWCVTALIGAVIALQAGAQQSFKVRLRPVPIEASTAANTTGAGDATAELAGTRLTVRGNFAGLKGAATVARLHQGAVMGVRGPAFADVDRAGRDERHFSADGDADARPKPKACGRGTSTCNCIARLRPTAISGAGCCHERGTLRSRRPRDRCHGAGERRPCPIRPVHRGASRRGPIVVSRELRGLPPRRPARRQRGAAARRRPISCAPGARAARRSSSRSWA